MSNEPKNQNADPKPERSRSSRVRRRRLKAGASPTLPEAHKTEDDTSFLCKQVASWFVQSKNNYFLVEKLSAPLTQANVRKISVRRIKERFPEVELTVELERDVFQRAIVEAHDDPEQSIPIWDGSTRCCPSVDIAVLPEGETVAINTWHKPAYRKLGDVEADTTMFDEFLARIFPHGIDQRVCKDWLAWNLQNETDKPAWGCCQTDSNQSQFPPDYRNLCRTELAPLGESGGAVELEIDA